MLAQAQECSWQAARMGMSFSIPLLPATDYRLDNYKNGLVSRISAKVTQAYMSVEVPNCLSKVSALYGLAHTTIREASPSIQYLFPPVSHCIRIFYILSTPPRLG